MACYCCGRPEFSHKDRPDTIAHGLHSLWKQKKFTDYKLTVGQHNFEVHRVVLAATTHRYRTLTANDLHSEVTGLCPTSVENVLGFMYTNTISLSKDNVENIGTTAKYFQIPSLVKLCSMFDKDGEYSPDEKVLVEGIRTLWENGKSFDFTILVGHAKIKVHRVILMTVSPFFRSELADVSQRSEAGYQLKNSSAEIFKVILKYIYTGKMDPAERKIELILEAATSFDITAVTSAWCTYCMGMLSIENDKWMKLASLFRTYGFVEQLKRVHQFIFKNLSDILRKPHGFYDYSNLHYEDLEVLIDNWNGLEFRLYTFIVKWIIAQYENGCQTPHGDLMLCKVRFCLLSPFELNVCKNQKDKDPNARWPKLVCEAIRYHKLPKHKRVLYKSEQNQIRGEPAFLMFMRFQEGCVLDYILGDLAKNEGLEIPGGYAMSEQYIEINNFLIVSLIESPKPLHIFDCRTTQWVEMADPPFKYASLAIAHDGRYLYIAGGRNRDATTNQVDRYDFKTNRWQTISKLPLLMNQHAACILDKWLYISGGFPAWFSDIDYHHPDKAAAFEKVGLKTLYRMDLSSRKWEYKAPMRQKHYRHAMHVLTIDDERVLCILNKDLSIEYYSPMKNEWSLCELRFSVPHNIQSYFSWVVHGNKIYLTGVKTSSLVLSDADITPEEQRSMVVVTVPEKGISATVETKYIYSPSELDAHLATDVVTCFQPYTCNPQAFNDELQRMGLNEH